MNKLQEEVNKRMILEPTSIIRNINVEKDIFPKVYEGRRITLSEAFAFIEAHASESITFGANKGYVMDFDKKDLVTSLTHGNITTSDTMLIKSIVDAISITPKSNFTSISSEDYKESVYNNVYPKYDNYLDFEYYYDFVIRLNPMELESIFNHNELIYINSLTQCLTTSHQTKNLLENIRCNRHYSLFGFNDTNKRICDTYDIEKDKKFTDFNDFCKQREKSDVIEESNKECNGILDDTYPPLVKDPAFVVEDMTCTNSGLSFDASGKPSITIKAVVKKTDNGLVAKEFETVDLLNTDTDAPSDNSPTLHTLVDLTKPTRKVGRPKKTPTDKDGVKTSGFAQTKAGTRKKSKYVPKTIKSNKTQDKAVETVKAKLNNYKTPSHITGKKNTTKGKE